MRFFLSTGLVSLLALRALMAQDHPSQGDSLPTTPPDASLPATEPAPAPKPAPVQPLPVMERNWSTNLVGEISASILIEKDWRASSQNLIEWLMKNYGADAVQQPSWHWMSGLQQWCELFASDTNITSQLDSAALAWLLTDTFLTEDFFANLSPKDKKPEVLNLLQQFHKEEPLHFPKYNRLALAMAFVWDVPRPAVPHHQVPPQAMAVHSSSPLDKFRFWIETNEKKIADYDLSKIEVEQLRFVVDAAAPLEELRWAQSTVRFNRGNFHQAYSWIKYDTPRLARREYAWRHPSYELKEIRKHGGICVDQAYFAATAGKANGIPALCFSGAGRDSWHAWFGYMKSNDRWSMDCGRYIDGKYAVGTTTDPQTDEPISDHEIAFLAEPFRNSKEYRVSRSHARQAVLFQAAGDSVKALVAVDMALKAVPKNLEAWSLKTDLLKSDPKATLTLQTHLREMMNQFMRYPDIKTACQQQLAELARQSGNTAAANQIEDRMVRDNIAKRHDLSFEVYQKKMRECCSKGDWKGGRTTVHDAVMKLKNEHSSLVELIVEFVDLCLANNQAEEADRAMKDFKSRVKIDSSSVKALSDAVALLQDKVKQALKNKK